MNRKLTRSRTDAKLGGVAAGLADYFGIDVTLARVLTFFAVLFTLPCGPIAYVALWVIMPVAEDQPTYAGPPTA